jgi:cell division protein FtsQ
MSGDKPVKLGRRILNGIAGIAVAVAIGIAALHGYEAVVALPVERVDFAGELDRIAKPDLDALSRAIVAADRPTIETVREAARRVPGVRDAAVRRVYPDAVEITIEAHVPLAQWDGERLVSRRGEVFAGHDASLPTFRGPESGAARMSQEFPAIAAALAPLGVVATLTLTPRGGWRAQLADGLTLELGREDWPNRVRRFVAAWPALSDEARTTRYADLRYPNGFALRRTAEIPPPKKK